MRPRVSFNILVFAVMLLTPACGAVVCAQTQSGGLPVPRGIMSFGWADNFLDTKSMDLPYISGMTAFAGWSSVEKEEGVFDYRALDQLIALAKAKGKIINIMCTAGHRTPEWVFQKGSKPFFWKHDYVEDQWETQGKNKSVSAPLPWDPIFIECWKRFITNMAEKYGSEPAVGYIAIAGPAAAGATTCLTVKDEAEWKRVVDAGYSDEKVLNAWIDIIEHYHKVLGNKRLVLALARDRRGEPGIERATALAKYVMDKGYTNISFFLVFLNDTWFQTGHTALEVRALLKQAKANGFSFGYQMAQSAHRNAKWRKVRPFVENLKDSLAIGISDGASWIEVWHDDIIDPRQKDAGVPNANYVADLKWAHDAFMGGGAR